MPVSLPMSALERLKTAIPLVNGNSADTFWKLGLAIKHALAARIAVRLGRTRAPFTLAGRLMNGFQWIGSPGEGSTHAAKVGASSMINVVGASAFPTSASIITVAAVSSEATRSVGEQFMAAA